MHVDITVICGSDPSVRSLFLQWTYIPSLITGSCELVEPETVSPSIPLSDPKIPVLCLMVALGAIGVTPDAGKQVYTPGGDKLYDPRGVASTRSYCQRLLAADELFRMGCCCIHEFGPTPSMV